MRGLLSPLRRRDSAVGPVLPLTAPRICQATSSTVLAYLNGEEVETVSSIAFPNSSASMALRLAGVTSAVAAAVIIASAVPTVTDLGIATASANPGAGNPHS